jgi:hypothetical protein
MAPVPQSISDDGPNLAFDEIHCTYARGTLHLQAYLNRYLMQSELFCSTVANNSENSGG